ncbi:TROVE domain-containing protein [Dysgonomonas sp. Marseille-P4677]|uniref:TROVE domain-containing protein n=1 Tax=Dysgonomonas sp. Marseille-P4677 TaxID=2364790 RepID=UPI001913552D|nr:TROVE domain-containing protein [Dysgonomonas sp. Marseille-P4677]MBK5720347.1 TROVE domain-containing protein [Dysgonomonas sp. Marseille-P4677]
MKFNFTTKGKNKAMNHEGESAYRLSPEWQLYTAAVTSSLSDKFYEKAETRVETLRKLIAQCDPVFVAQLAIYTRQKMNMRSISLVLAVELAKVHRGDSTVCKMVSGIVQRADEITELLAYYQLANQRKDTKKLNRLSKQLQSGLQDAFNKFDEYQFAKYNRDTEVKLRDALFLVHPKAKDKAQQVLFNKIINNELETPYTWETELSSLGQTKFTFDKEKEIAFRMKWEELIDSRKVGYMALMRNLRNILEAEVSQQHIMSVCETLSNAEAVRRSKQLPFRFLAAYREISKVKSAYAGRIMNALEQAVAISAENISGFDADTKVLIAADVSGSMQQAISPKSKILSYDIGLMLAMLLKSRCKNAITGMFGDKWKVINVPTKGILSNVDAFYRREGEVGYATNGYLVINDLLKSNQRIDKVMMFTDCQLWNNRNDKKIADLWDKYKKISPESKLYLFDLSGYGTTPLDITREDVCLIAGWSDKVFDIIAAIDRGDDALDEIRKIEL